MQISRFDTLSNSISRRFLLLAKKNEGSYLSFTVMNDEYYFTGPSSLGVPGVPGHTQILADQLTLFQPGGTDYANLITTGTPGFSDLTTALL